MTASFDGPTYDIVVDPDHRYRRLDPVPDGEALSDFYQSAYPEMLRKGEVAESVARLLEHETGEAKRERQWRRKTWYTDVRSIVEELNPSASRVLDVGAGTGNFLAFMNDAGYNSVGVEPSKEIGAVARDRGLTVHMTTIEGIADRNIDPFDVISMFNVLEHVPNPVQVLRIAHELLRPGGILIVKVPNDFNSLQMSAKKVLGLDDWWVVPPVHVSYFDYSSLQSLMEEIGFFVEMKMGDFPMEMFLLMGENYVQNSEIGAACHEKRVRFEESMSGGMRRTLYEQLAAADVGRNCVLFGIAG